MTLVDRNCVWKAAFVALTAFVALMAIGIPLVASDSQRAGATAADRDEAGTETRIARLIEQLGADDFAARERAQSELAQLGLEAYDALHAAQSHHDPEISLRSKYLVRSMNPRWFADSDPPKVIAVLKEYGELNEEQRRNRIDRLAMLEDNLGLAPLVRLARFETADTLAKYAAIKVLDVTPPDEAAKDSLIATIQQVIGRSKRPAATWLLLYARTLADPEPVLADWDRATQDEHAVLAKSPERTSRDIVRDLYRYQVELLKRLGHDDDAITVMRRTFALLDGTPPQVQEIVDWLMHRQAWQVALEVMEKFAATVQDSPRLLYRLAETHEKLGEHDKATAAASRALALHPESLDDHLLIGHELEETPGLAQWAEGEYRQVLKAATPASKADFKARFVLSELLHDRLKELEAAQTLQPVADLLAKDDTAKSTCEVAGRPPELVLARMNFFYACHDHEQQHYAAEKKHLQLAADAFYKDADVLIAMYRLPQADDAWQRSAKERIETVVTEYHREVEESRAALETADSEPIRRELTANLASNCNQYAWLVGNTFGDYPLAVKFSQEAVRISQQLLELKPHYPGFLDTLGRAHYAAGDLVNAVKSQSLASSLNPASGQIRRQLDFFKREAAERGIDVSAAAASSSSERPPSKSPEKAAEKPQ
jgi:tetratricopeptide (TPR) repeat protein